MKRQKWKKFPFRACALKVTQTIPGVKNPLCLCSDDGGKVDFFEDLFFHELYANQLLQVE